MIFESNVEVYGFDAAVRGMRNSFNSWHLSDSTFESNDYTIGINDLNLMHKLYLAGESHSKFMRMIQVYMDVLAPLYWWKEFDTYKIGTVVNSCSTMHTITDREFNVDDFAHDQLDELSRNILLNTVYALNTLRSEYLDTNDKKYWYSIIQLLPESYCQKRTINMNYQVVANIIEQRKDHKLNEWIMFCDILKGLPYLYRIINGIGKED